MKDGFKEENGSVKRQQLEEGEAGLEPVGVNKSFLGTHRIVSLGASSIYLMTKCSEKQSKKEEVLKMVLKSLV